jgi:signal transduction histidine kinase
MNFELEKPHSQLIDRLFWLINLRWIAIGGLILTLFSATLVIHIPLFFFPLWTLVSFLVFYNTIFYFILQHLKTQPEKIERWPSIIANLQISLDLYILLVLIHYAGGLENPFVFYFIFHMIIAGILLSRRAAFLQATFAVLLLSALAAIEFWGILPHYHLLGFTANTLYYNPTYILGILFVFTSTLYIAVYMASSISFQLRQREKSLEEANQRLEENDRIKSEYVLRVTHDIKEHLAAVQTCIEPVADEMAGPLNTEQKDLLVRAKARTHKLLWFVRALLDLTRLKLTRELKMEVFSFKDLLLQIVPEIKQRAGNKNIEFKFEMDPSIENLLGVRLYLESALMNLFSNALKYTPAGGQINLQVKDERNYLRIIVEDSGIGIPDEAKPHIFDEFYRAKNAQKIEKMGSGLGLSLAKKIIEMHKGQIWTESKLGIGTKFVIEIEKKS